jgi:hypothetical protein
MVFRNGLANVVTIIALGIFSICAMAAFVAVESEQAVKEKCDRAGEIVTGGPFEWSCKTKKELER